LTYLFFKVTTTATIIIKQGEAKLTPKQIKKLRENKKMTQIEMANDIGVKPSTYITWESGRSEPSGSNRCLFDTYLSNLLLDLMEGE
jgi:DNA-binding transcriptional regulator YiaG